MKSKETICAVVVTFNRKELLLKCLKAIIEQSHSVDALIIVDNFSSDGTAESLLEHDYINEMPPESLSEPIEIKNSFEIKKSNDTNSDVVERQKISGTKVLKVFYVRMNENTGGAGGFHEGVKRGYEKGYDWLWLMDDDGYPDVDCLTKLLENCKNSLKVINPLVVNQENHSKLSFGLDCCKNVQSAIKISEDGLIMNEANPFNGTLLNSEVVSKCGNIKKEMFIWGDETEYFLRIKKYEFQYATVVDARFYHPESKTHYVPILFGLGYLPMKPEKLEMNYYRNQAFISSKYYNKHNLKLIIKYFIYCVQTFNINKLFIFMTYYIDGASNKFKLPNLRK